jgi:hypothetical protein
VRSWARGPGDMGSSRGMNKFDRDTFRKQKRSRPGFLSYDAELFDVRSDLAGLFTYHCFVTIASSSRIISLD